MLYLKRSSDNFFWCRGCMIHTYFTKIKETETEIVYQCEDHGHPYAKPKKKGDQKCSKTIFMPT